MSEIISYANRGTHKAEVASHGRKRTVYRQAPGGPVEKTQIVKGQECELRFCVPAKFYSYEEVLKMNAGNKP